MPDPRKTAVAELAEAHIGRLCSGDDLLDEISHFQKQLEKDSFSQRVNDALLFRKQGHFDKAMLEISEVNRDQITALRKVQSLLAKVDDEPYPVPVFEKFRQHGPFEIGLSDAAPILQLLGELTDQSHSEISDTVSLFHKIEGKIRDESGYIDFLNKKGSVASELEKAEVDRNDLILQADEVRTVILRIIFKKIDFRTENLEPSKENSLLYLELVQGLFQVITSSIAIKHSIDVDVS